MLLENSYLLLTIGLMVLAAAGFAGVVALYRRRGSDLLAAYLTFLTGWHLVGLTTVLGLLSFLAMDIQPMRTFGLFTAIGIFATLVFSLTFVPAVIVVLRLGAS